MSGTQVSAKDLKAEPAGLSAIPAGSYGKVQDEPASLIDVRHLIGIVTRRWWVVLLAVTLVTSLAALILFRMTPVYQAVSLLEVKQQQRNVVGTNPVDDIVVDREFLSTQIELLKSQSLSEEVVESMGLIRDPYLAPVDNEGWNALPRAEKLRIATRNFRDNLDVRPVGRSRLISVTFLHPEPAEAARITNTVTESFISNNLAQKVNSTTFAREFLEDRLETVRASLEQAERELVNYATESNIIIVDGENAREASGSLDVSSLKRLNEELTQAMLDTVEAKVAYDQALNNNFPAKILENEALNSLKSARIDINNEYQDKLALYREGFPEVVEVKSRLDNIDGEIENVSTQIIESARLLTKEAYDRAVAREQDLSARVAALKAAVVDTREKSIDYNILQRQVETERSQYEALLQRLKEVSVSDDLGSSLVNIVDEARPPQVPAKPNRPLWLAVALLLGGALGFAVAYILEVVNDVVETVDDVGAKLGQALIGVIPEGKQVDDFISVLGDPQSESSEAYASARANLQFSGPDGGPRVIQVTSTRSGEGKSVSSAGLALRFAGIGQRVLLIDADMRRPTFRHETKKSIGLSGLLTSRENFADHILKTQTEGLSVLPSGPIVPNPSEILSSSRFDELLSYARKTFDYIIVDSPPVLGLADAPTIAAKVDGTLYVIDSGTLRTSHVRNALSRLSSRQSRLIGVLLTKYERKNARYSDYYMYDYKYAEAQPKRGKKGMDKEEREKRRMLLS
ncbi:MAG: polysaccharide biosynthesis tyrosine autokinase [Litorimonas sp.]